VHSDELFIGETPVADPAAVAIGARSSTLSNSGQISMR
jgi:hypothetical protein